MKLNVVFSKSYYGLLSLLLICLVMACGGEKSMKTPSGFELMWHEKNDGPKAKEGEWVYFRYTERRNQEVLYKLPSDLPDQKFVIPGAGSTDKSLRMIIIEALAMMSVGDSATIVMPYSEEFGSLMNWGPGDTSIFDLRLTSIKTEEEYQKDLELERQARIAKQEEDQVKSVAIGETLTNYINQFKSGKLQDVKDFPSGLKIFTIEEGKGSIPSQGQKVKVDYYGALMDGSRFDDSISRGTPFTFALGRGQVIPGWDEALSNITVGSKAVIFLPPALAYGEAGAPPVIGPNSDLAFYIHFLGIEE
jgi:FKBP-type peptidyl-prolyl cis-trans isomerase